MRFGSFMTGVDIALALLNVFVIVAKGALAGVDGRAGALTEPLGRIGRGAEKAGDDGRGGGIVSAPAAGMGGMGSSLNRARANAMLSGLGAWAVLPDPVVKPVEKPVVGGWDGPGAESASPKRASARARASEDGGGADAPLPSWNPDVDVAGIGAGGFGRSSPKNANARARAASDCDGASRPLAIANPLFRTKGLSGGAFPNIGAGKLEDGSGVSVVGDVAVAGGGAGDSVRLRLLGASSNSASRSASRTILSARDMAASDGLGRSRPLAVENDTNEGISAGIGSGASSYSGC